MNYVGIYMLSALNKRNSYYCSDRGCAQDFIAKPKIHQIEQTLSINS